MKGITGFPIGAGPKCLGRLKNPRMKRSDGLPNGARTLDDNTFGSGGIVGIMIETPKRHAARVLSIPVEMNSRMWPVRAV